MVKGVCLSHSAVLLKVTKIKMTYNIIERMLIILSEVLWIGRDPSWYIVLNAINLHTHTYIMSGIYPSNHLKCQEHTFALTCKSLQFILTVMIHIVDIQASLEEVKAEFDINHSAIKDFVVNHSIRPCSAQNHKVHISNYQYLVNGGSRLMRSCVTYQNKVGANDLCIYWRGLSCSLPSLKPKLTFSGTLTELASRRLTLEKAISTPFCSLVKI